MARRPAEQYEDDPEYALQQYDDTFLLCRDLRHAWATQGFYKAGRDLRRRLVCERCGTERTDIWSATGETRLGNAYRYPDGFKIGRGITWALVRQEVVSRVTIYENEEQMLNALFSKPRARKR